MRFRADDYGNPVEPLEPLRAGSDFSRPKGSLQKITEGIQARTKHRREALC